MKTPGRKGEAIKYEEKNPHIFIGRQSTCIDVIETSIMIAVIVIFLPLPVDEPQCNVTHPTYGNQSFRDHWFKIVDKCLQFSFIQKSGGN